MPLLSKKAFALPNKTKTPFKVPLLTKENIEKVLNAQNKEVSKRGKFDNDNISNSSSGKSRYKKKTIRKSVSLTLSIEQTGSQTSKKSNDTPKIVESPSLDQSASKFDQSIDDLFDDTPHDDSGVASALTEEVLSRPEVKEKYLKHWDETFPKELEDDFWKFSQEWIESGLLDTKKGKKNVKKDNTSTPKQKKETTKKKATQKKMFENLLNEKNKHVKKRNEKTDATGGSEDSLKKNGKEISKKTDGKIKRPISKENSIETAEELYERMMKIQESRNVGLYVYCDSCNKTRYLPDTKDPLDLPPKWYCNMNPDPEHNKCTDPEVVVEDEEFLIHNLYNAGSIVWAKMDGFPWWPAMVEDDPDTEDYFWLEGDSLEPTWYHVTFFDSYEVSRAWMRPLHLKPFQANMKNPVIQEKKRTNQYKTRLGVAVKQAGDACALALLERLRTYSFIKRYKKPLVSKNKKRKNSATKIGNKKIGEKKRRRVIRIESSEDFVDDSDEIPVDVDKLLENLTSDINNLFP